MKRMFAIAILLLGSMFVLPFAAHPAQGVLPTGVVCIAPSTSTKCPAPYTVGDVPVGSTFVVGVFIDNSQAMGGFDIYVSVDPTYLHPNSAALGPLIVSPTSTSICVNNVASTGACTTSSPNGNGVVEVTTAESSGSNECGGIAPCSGMAFTINYTVVAKTAATSISYPTYALPTPSTSVCATSSVSSPADVCVLVSDASGNTLPETVQTGSFTSLDPTANFFASPTTGVGPLTVGFDASISTPTPTHAITNYTWTFGDGNVTKLTGATLSPTVSHIYYTSGAYRPSLQTTDTSGNVSSITDTLTITVLKANFTMTALPVSLVIRPGGNQNASVTLTSINETAGTISLSNNGTSVALGVTANWTSTSASLSAVASTSVPVRFSVSSSASSATFNVTITASYAYNVSKTSRTTVSHSSSIKIQIAGFNYALSNSGNAFAPRGGSGSTKITLQLKGILPGKPVTLSLTGTTLPPGVTYSFSPSSVIPTTAGNSSVLTFTTTGTTPASSQATKVTVTGTPLGATTNNTILSFFVTDFSISASPSPLSIPQGGNGITVVNPIGQAGFNANISLAATPLSRYIIVALNLTSLVLTPESLSNTTALYIIVAPRTPAGNYGINVTGAVGQVTHSFIVTVTVPTPDFSATSAPTSLTITAGTSGTSTITLIGLNGFVGTITLSPNSAPAAGISSTLASTSVTITSSSGPVGSTLTISTLATTVAGTYTINITATSGSIKHFAIVTLTVTAPQSSVSLAGATISPQSATAGKSVSMNVSISDTGAAPVNITITMDVNSGTGSNITVAQETVTLTPGLQAQMFTLTWDTTQWSSGTYHVYARIIGSQTNTVNQAQAAGTLSLTSTSTSGGGGVNLSVLPWVTTGILGAVAVVFGLLLFRRRPTAGSKAL